MPNNKAHKIFLTPAGVDPLDITGESISVPAGDAGVVVDFYISRKPIIDGNKSYIGGFGNSSVSLTSTAFDSSEVESQTADGDLANGEYWINYITGRGRGKKADNSTSMTADYSIFILA